MIWWFGIGIVLSLLAALVNVAMWFVHPQARPAFGDVVMFHFITVLAWPITIPVFVNDLRADLRVRRVLRSKNL